MKQLLAVVTFLLVCSFDQLSLAQSAARITEKIDPTASIRIAHTKHPLLKSAKDMGRVDGSMRMDRMMLLLKPSKQQEQELNSLIASQQDKQSPSYHQWLTPVQYASHFGPSSADVDQIIGWLRQRGFVVGSIAHGKQWIEFSGNASQVEAAFQTEMHHFLVNGEKHIANSTDISIPRALAPVVRGVLSLHDFRARPLHKAGYQVRRDAVTGKLIPAIANNAGVQTGTTPNFTQPETDRHFISPGDWSRIYNTAPLLTNGTTGSGISIAVVGADSDVQLSDIRTFRQIFGLPAKDPVFIVNGTDPGVFPFSDAEVEADLDIEWAGAVAPEATIKFVTSASTAASDGFSLSLAYIVDNRIAPIMSNSIGGCEMFFGTAGNAFLNTVFRQAAAEGISVISAAGDSGAAGCDPQQSFNPAFFGPAVNAAASTPYDVAIGGTMFAENGQADNFWASSNRADLSTAKGYIPEAIWNESCDLSTDPNSCFGTGLFILSAGSGGPSSCTASTYSPDTDSFTCTSGGYSKPSWQAGVGVPDDGVRDIPDISFTAAAGHDGYLMCVEGSCQSSIMNGQTVLTDAFVVGGTSAGAPAFSGVMALLEQKKQPYQGLLNFNLYQLAAQDDLAACDSTTLTNPAQRGNCTFYDVTAGNNDVPGQPGASAGLGFDLASGLGSVNVAKLIARWDSGAKLQSNTTLFIDDHRDFEHGQAIPMRVFVRPTKGGGSPTGDFSFVTHSLGSVSGGTLSNGSFTGGVRNLPGGDYQVIAHYGGDAMFASSDSQPARVKIRPEASMLEVQEWELTVNPSRPVVAVVEGPVAYGQPVGLQMNVKGNSGVGAASGNLTILMDGKKTFGPLQLNQAGNAFFWLYNTEPDGITPGTHKFSVSYEGDNSFKPTTAAAAPLLIEKAGAIIVFASPVQASIDPNNFTNVLTAGAPVDIFVEIGPWFDVLWGLGKKLPTGTIQMYECFSPLNDVGDCTGPWVPSGAPQTLSPNGPAGPLVPQTVFRRSFTAGDHRIRFTYSGDNNYVSLLLDAPLGRTATNTLTIEAAPSATISLTQQVAAINIGQSAAYTISVKPAHAGGPAASGTVSLIDVFNNQLAGPLNLVNGSASFSVPWYMGGHQLVYAFYWGDGNYPALASPSIITNVRPLQSPLTLTSSAVSLNSGSTATLTAGLPAPPNSNIPPAGAMDFYQQQGQVEYWDSVNGGAPQLLGTGPQFLTVGNGNISINALPVVLPQGRNSITANFLGTSDWTPVVSNTVIVNVSKSPAGN